MQENYNTLITCKHCQQDLPHEAYYWTKWGMLAHGYSCRKCSNARNLKRYRTKKAEFEGVTSSPMTCRACQRELPETEFVKNPSYKAGYTGRCRECTKARNFKAKGTLKWFRAYKQTLSCEVCGESTPCCLDFHHRNPKEKEGVVAQLAHHSTIERVQEEIAKCSVYCANCHRKHHAGLLKVRPV